MQIPVTQEHITNGKTRCPERCAVALAIADALPVDRVAHQPSIGTRDMRVYRNGYPLHLQNSPELEVWITTFDDTGKGTPFTLALDFEQKTARIIGDNNQ